MGFDGSWKMPWMVAPKCSNLGIGRAWTYCLVWWRLQKSSWWYEDSLPWMPQPNLFLMWCKGYKGFSLGYSGCVKLWIKIIIPLNWKKLRTSLCWYCWCHGYHCLQKNKRGKSWSSSVGVADCLPWQLNVASVLDRLISTCCPRGYGKGPKNKELISAVGSQWI